MTEKSPVDCSSTSTLITTRSGAEPGSLVILTFLKKFEILDAPLGAIDQRAVVGIAFGDIELAPDDIIAGARVAADVDALDVGARAFVDDVDDADRVRLRRLRSPRGRTVANG